MPGTCSVCSVPCENEVKCAGNCGASCHLNCAPQRTRGAKKDWFCESCKPDKERSSSLASSQQATVCSISKEFFLNTLESFKQEMLAEFKKHIADNTEIKTSLNHLSDAVDQNNKLMDSLMKEMKETQEQNLQILKENDELRNLVHTLEFRVRNLEQYSRKQNIEIDGIPETKGENVHDILKDVSKAVGVEMKEEMVVAAHRIPSFNKKRTSPIIVRFATYDEKDKWIAGFKNVRPLTANKVNASFNASLKVFINEHLSPENKQLLSKTKEAAKNKNFKYVWTRDGKIFVRKIDGEKCKRIDTLYDLEKL